MSSGPATFSDDEGDDYSMELPDVGGDGDNENGSVDDSNPFTRIQKNITANSGIGAVAGEGDWRTSGSTGSGGTGSDDGSTTGTKSSSRRKTPAGPAKQLVSGRKASSRISYKDDDLSSPDEEMDDNDEDDYMGSGGSDQSDDDFGNKRTSRRSGSKGGKGKRGGGSKGKGRGGSGARARSKSGGGVGRPSRAKAAKKVIEEIVLDEEEDYEIEEILDKKIERGKVIYYLSWKGFDSSHNSWEPMENLNCPELIEVYEAKQRAKKVSPVGAGQSSKPKYRPGPASRTKKRDASPPVLENESNFVEVKKTKLDGPDTLSDEDIENVNFEADGDDFQAYDNDDEIPGTLSEKVNHKSKDADLPEGHLENEHADSQSAVETESSVSKSKVSDKPGSPECLHCSKRIYQGIYRKKYALSSQLNIPAKLNVYEGLTLFYTNYKGAYPLVFLEPIEPPEKETRFVCNNCAELIENYCTAMFKITEVSSNTSAISLRIGDLQPEKDDWLGIEDDDVVSGSGQVNTPAAKKFYPEDHPKDK